VLLDIHQSQKYPEQVPGASKEIDTTPLTPDRMGPNLHQHQRWWEAEELKDEEFV
jgi:hypothetical protein